VAALVSDISTETHKLKQSNIKELKKNKRENNYYWPYYIYKTVRELVSEANACPSRLYGLKLLLLLTLLLLLFLYLRVSRPPSPPPVRPTYYLENERLRPGAFWGSDKTGTLLYFFLFFNHLYFTCFVCSKCSDN
jgi:hypothetical protein